MQLVGALPWLALGVLLAVLAPRIPTWIVGAILILAGIAVFAVRLHHAGPYPFPGAVDLAFGCAALAVGGLLVRPPGALRVRRALLGISPIVLLLALVAFGHEAEEVVVLRTTDPNGSLRETRLWVMDHEGAPWIVTGRDSPHDRNVAARPRVEIFRRGEARCWIAERHTDRDTVETLLGVRSEKYRTQRIAFTTGIWKHFSDYDDLEELAVALRFTPCPAGRE